MRISDWSSDVCSSDLVTLALAEVVRLTIVAMRDYTGGSLGLTPRQHGEGVSWWALQFADKDYFYLIALVCWGFGLWVWWKIDRSMARYAKEAITENEDASETVGIKVMAKKIRITVISAMLSALKRKSTRLNSYH